MISIVSIISTSMMLHHYFFLVVGIIKLLVS